MRREIEDVGELEGRMGERKDCIFTWSTSAVEYFTSSKTAFITAPGLKQFVAAHDTIGETDFSEYVVSGVLAPLV